jgi:CheY-like chemotaxis protein
MVRVMVVDDSGPQRQLLRQLVDTVAGFRTVGTAESGEEALAALEELRADLVLMDVRMPGAGGVAAARATEELPHPPLVVLTSSDDRPDIEADPPAHGAAAFVRKETMSARLLQQLWSALGKSRA